MKEGSYKVRIPPRRENWIGFVAYPPLTSFRINELSSMLQNNRFEILVPKKAQEMIEMIIFSVYFI